MSPNPIFAALDTPALATAQTLSAALSGMVGGIKLGLEFFLAQGPSGIATVAQGQPFFLDLKLHDIPNTVAAAVRSVAPLKPALLTLHAAGGSAMMRAAKDAADASAIDGPPMKLLGVTVLTSLDSTDLTAIGQWGPVGDQVALLANLAQESGLDGIVCSSHEVERLRRQCGPDFLLVVPGIRPEGVASGDQKRTMTPSEAMAAGASHLVIGRPITQAPDPRAAARAIVASLTPPLVSCPI